MSTDNTLQNTAADWLSKFATSLQSADLEGVASNFLPNGWLRDIVTFTWNNRSLSGKDQIISYLRDTLAAAKISEVKLDNRPGLSPQPSSISPGGVASGFTYMTSIAIGQGFFHLTKDDSGEWKALAVLMKISDLKGHEELGPEAGVYEGHTLAWEDLYEQRRQHIEENPHVIIGIFKY